MFGLSPMELMIVFLLIVLLFGAKRLPDLARSLGKSIKEFKHATQDLKQEFDVDKIGESTPPPSPRSNSESSSKPAESRKTE